MRVARRTGVSAMVVGALALAVAGAAAGGAVAGEAASTARTAAAPKPKPTPVAPRPIASRPTTAKAWTARVVVPVHPRTAPRASARRMALLTGAGPYNGNPEVLLVTGARSTVRHGLWYRVLLHSRPNDASGWVPAAAVRVVPTRMRILVDISQRRLTLLRADRRVGSWRVAVGSRANPTPTGRFAISEIVPQRTSTGFYGGHIITLTAHSEKLNEFDGGDGRVALHGSDRPELLGRAISHGCVRMSNASIARVARMAPPGTPIDIVP